MERQRIAKGEIREKTFIIINLKEYEKAKFINPTEIRPLTSPSNENKLKSWEFIGKISFIFSIKAEKDIEVSNKELPADLIKIDIYEQNNTK